MNEELLAILADFAVDVLKLPSRVYQEEVDKLVLEYAEKIASLPTPLKAL